MNEGVHCAHGAALVEVDLGDETLDAAEDGRLVQSREQIVRQRGRILTAAFGSSDLHGDEGREACDVTGNDVIVTVMITGMASL